MLYGVEACPINKSQTKSLDFAVTGACMKIFNTTATATVTQCTKMCDFPTVCAAVLKRKSRFLSKYSSSTNALCKVFTNSALDELTSFFG